MLCGAITGTACAHPAPPAWYRAASQSAACTTQRMPAVDRRLATRACDGLHGLWSGRIRLLGVEVRQQPTRRAAACYLPALAAVPA